MDISGTIARVAPDLLKALAILSDTTVRSSAVDQEDLKPYCKSEKKATLVKFFNDFTNHSKKTNKAVVFSCRLSSNILKYRDHQ